MIPEFWSKLRYFVFNGEIVKIMGVEDGMQRNSL